MIGVFTSSNNGLMDKNLKCMYVDYYGTDRCIKALRLTSTNESYVSFLLITTHVHSTLSATRICNLGINNNSQVVKFNSTIISGEAANYEELYINDSMELYTQTDQFVSVFLLPLCGFNYELINEQTPQLDLSSLKKLV